MADVVENGEKQRAAKREWARQSQQDVRDIAIRFPRDLKLRKRLEKDIYRWLKHYFADLFYNPFNDGQRRIIGAILSAASDGDDQAIAAPRGGGKTSIAECVIVFCVLTGRLKFPLIAAATGPDAQNILANIKRHFEINEELQEQYPEVCDPIVALEGANQRANMQTCCGGHRTRLKWGTDKIVFPDVPEIKSDDGKEKIASRCCGSVLMTRGLDSAIRGIRHGTLRPDLVLIDDPETRESAESETQIQKRKRTIDSDIGGLGGPNRRLGRIMLTTLMNRVGVSYQYTDPAAYPSWRGIRQRLLITPPDSEDLWGEYVELRRASMSKAVANEESVEDAVAIATTFYTDRRKQMDAGAVVADKHRYDAHHEVSALQHCYNIIADFGKDTFATEFQNDPPETMGPQESGIYPDLVASRLNGLQQSIIPPTHNVLTAGIDIGKAAIHWCVTAWCKSGNGSVIDYGVQDVWPSNRDNDKAVELAILQALYGLRDQLQNAYYCTPDGEVLPLHCALVDSGNWEKPVYEFVRATGDKNFRASKGFGETSDGRKSYFRAPDDSTALKKVGDHCFLHHKQQAGIWLCGLDSDYWKAWLHERFLTPETAENGKITLFGSDKRRHFAFAHHICAEVEVEEFIEGKGLKRYWKRVNRNNHWLDTLYMACVAASLHGMKLFSASAPVSQQHVRHQQQRLGRQRFLSRPGGWIRGMQ